MDIVKEPLLKLYMGKKLANIFTLIVYHIGAEKIVKRGEMRGVWQSLCNLVKHFRLHFKILISDLVGLFVEEFEGESPRSKLEQERGQTDGRKWLKNLGWRKRDRY